MFMRINRAVRTFDAFTPDNAPVGEHDLGTLEVDGYVFIFKIDYATSTWNTPRLIPLF